MLIVYEFNPSNVSKIFFGFNNFFVSRIIDFILFSPNYLGEISSFSKNNN